MSSISTGHKPVNYYTVNKFSAVSIVNGHKAGRSRSCGSISNRRKRFSLIQNVQTRCAAHSPYYYMWNRSSFADSKAAGGWNWTLTSPSSEVKDAYMPSRPTPGQLETRQAFASCYSIDPANIQSIVFHIILRNRFWRFSTLYASWKTARAAIIMYYQWQSVLCWQVRKQSIHSIHLF
jgi:hypothetical protein